jgi:methyltransferase (TIGR00027 family)
MADQPKVAPDSSAVRVALWRALHLMVDAPPHVFEDTLALKLADPEPSWRQRGDMHALGTRQFRASIVGRARLIEDLVDDQLAGGVEQYVILGAGLDSFAQRRTDVAGRLRVFEIDQPGAQAWKRQRLLDLGFGIPQRLQLVPVDFEAGDDWMQRLIAAGFDTRRRALVASTGVSMYLTKDALAVTLRKIAALASGTTLAMSFLVPIELAAPELQPGLRMAERGARASGTPFLSFFTPDEILALARDAGFKHAQHISADAVAQRYFAGRPDGLRPPANTEELLIAST